MSYKQSLETPSLLGGTGIGQVPDADAGQVADLTVGTVGLIHKNNEVLGTRSRGATIDLLNARWTGGMLSGNGFNMSGCAYLKPLTYIIGENVNETGEDKGSRIRSEAGVCVGGQFADVGHVNFKASYDKIDGIESNKAYSIYFERIADSSFDVGLVTNKRESESGKEDNNVGVVVRGGF